MSRQAMLRLVNNDQPPRPALSELDLAHKTSDNARRFFRLPDNFSPANEVANDPVSDFYRL